MSDGKKLKKETSYPLFDPTRPSALSVVSGRGTWLTQDGLPYDVKPPHNLRRDLIEEEKGGENYD